MMPAAVSESAGTLLMAFGESIDYTALYAIEQLLGYRTEPCLVCPSLIARSLQTLARHRGRSDVVFDGLEDAEECARIAANYAATSRAEEVRVAQCSGHFWIRLEQARSEPVNLVFCARKNSQFSSGRSQFPDLSSQ